MTSFQGGYKLVILPRQTNAYATTHLLALILPSLTNFTFPDIQDIVISVHLGTCLTLVACPKRLIVVQPIMRRPTSILVLPQELLDLVIDHFYDDLATLCHCALVARAWLQPAQTHLFRDIRLRHSIDIFTFRRLMTHRGYIARSVRTLRINAKIFKPRYYGNRPVESPYIDTIQGGIFTSLGQLRTLHFEDVYFDIFPLDCGLLDAIGQLPIHELKFSKCDFRNFETFERFVFANTRCTHLSLDDIKWKEAPDHTTFSESLTAHRAALGLTHISLGSYCEIDLYSNWLAQTSALLTLRSLEMIGLTRMRDVKLAGDLLKRLAGTLQHLRLKCSFSYAYESQLVRQYIFPPHEYLSVTD